MQDFAKQFYKSQAWKTTRAAVFSARKGLCDLCLRQGLYVPAEIVHHKTPLTPANIHDPNITLNWDNLQLLCRDCHARMHDAKQRRYKFDKYGRLQLIP